MKKISPYNKINEIKDNLDESVVKSNTLNTLVTVQRYIPVASPVIYVVKHEIQKELKNVV